MCKSSQNKLAVGVYLGGYGTFIAALYFRQQFLFRDYKTC